MRYTDKSISQDETKRCTVHKNAREPCNGLSGKRIYARPAEIIEAAIQSRPKMRCEEIASSLMHIYRSESVVTRDVSTPNSTSTESASAESTTPESATAESTTLRVSSRN